MEPYRIDDWMRQEQLRRQALFTDLFAGRPVEHIPLEIRVSDNAYSVREHYLDGDKQCADGLRSVQLTWDLGEHTDAIPCFFADVGCSCIANAFGAPYEFLGGPDQTPSVRRRVLDDPDDLEAQVAGLLVPDLVNAQWISEGLRRMRRFADLGQGFTPQCGLDAAGGLNVAADLMGVSELLVAMLTEPQAVHRLLDVIQETYLALIALEVEACGGLEQMTTTDFYAGWCPMGHKGHCSDDISAMIQPSLYRTFSAPYHARIYEVYGCGGLHNCGPNPCHNAYMSGPGTPRYLDLNEDFSRKDLERLKTSLKGRGFVRWGSDARDPVQIVASYRAYMELLAPDLILVPTYTVSTPEEGRALYDALLPLAREYAARMEFGFPLAGTPAPEQEE